MTLKVRQSVFTVSFFPIAFLQACCSHCKAYLCYKGAIEEGHLSHRRCRLL